LIGSAAVTVAERSWNHRAGSSAGDLGQTVAGGQVAEVTEKLGSKLGDVAGSAFTTGMRAGLALAAAALLIGATAILAGSRRRPPAPAPVPAGGQQAAPADAAPSG
jgi:hypothetical protein